MGFLGRQLSAAQSELSLVDDIQTSLDAKDYYGAIADFSRFYSMAKSEVVWLNAHRPASCFSKAWASARNEWTQFREAASAGRTALRDVDYDALYDYQMHLDKGVAYQSSVTAAIAKVNCP